MWFHEIKHRGETNEATERLDNLFQWGFVLLKPTNTEGREKRWAVWTPPGKAADLAVEQGDKGDVQA